MCEIIDAVYNSPVAKMNAIERSSSYYRIRDRMNFIKAIENTHEFLFIAFHQLLLDVESDLMIKNHLPLPCFAKYAIFSREVIISYSSRYTCGETLIGEVVKLRIPLTPAFTSDSATFAVSEAGVAMT